MMHPISTLRGGLRKRTERRRLDALAGLTTNVCRRDQKPTWAKAFGDFGCGDV